MSQTIFVYSSVLIVLFSFSLIAYKKSQVSNFQHVSFFSWEIVASIILFSLTFGLRYNVGIDYENYAFSYNVGDFARHEYIFQSVEHLLFSVNASQIYLFTLCVFLQFFFLLYAFRKERFLYPSLIFTLICGQYFLLWMNVIRQDIATCIFIFAISFIADKKFLKYLFWIVIASGFHRTAMILLVFYPIFMVKKDYFKSTSFQLILYVFGLIIYVRNISLFGDMDAFLNSLLLSTNFEDYAYGAISNTFIEKNVVGVSFISKTIINLSIVFYGKKMKKYFNSDRFLIFYNLFFIGVVLELLLAQSFILLRPVRYLRFFQLVLTAYLLYYLYIKGSNVVNFVFFSLVIVALIVLFVAIFLYSPDAHYQFQFIFQKNLFT